MRILFVGEDPTPGSGTYLLAILKALRATTVHVPSGVRLQERLLARHFETMLFSDYQRAHLSRQVERVIAEQVADGAGLLMVGGWSSFSGPFGRWRGSRIEELLPVRCRNRDDRMNFPGGAFLLRAGAHPIVAGLDFSRPPVVCGLNDIQPKPRSRTLLSARRIRWQRHGRLSLEPKAYPLLVINAEPDMRAAALATDAAPHWCGGLVDWGSKRMTLKVTVQARVEVGDQYVRFISQLIRWLARQER